MHFHPEALFIIQAMILIGVPFFIWNVPAIKKYTPLVVIQIILGIVLGPSVLGTYLPDVFHTLFPTESLPILNGVAWMALIIFGFLTGLHLDLDELAKKGKSFLVISISTIIVPAVIGAIAAIGVYNPTFLGPNATQTTFIFGMAIATAVTALPVLGAILMELKVIDTENGQKALGYASMNDILLWLMVAVLIAMTSASKTAEAGSSSSSVVTILTTMGLSASFMAFQYFIVKPFMASLAKKKVLTDHPTNKELVIIFVLMLLSGLATDLIGIHYLLGTFIFGAMLPKSIAHGIQHALEQFVAVAMLPFFFMLTGLKTSFSVTDNQIWILFFIMMLASTTGKILGTAIPEKLFGSSNEDAMQLGLYMRTKGLMDVVILNVLLSGGVISTVAFSAMIFVTVFTTATTKPLLLLLENWAAKKSVNTVSGKTAWAYAKVKNSSKRR